MVCNEHRPCPCHGTVTKAVSGIALLRAGHALENQLPLLGDVAMAKDAHRAASRRIARSADIGVFDPATVGSSNRGEWRYDLPGGGKRMVMPSRGVRYTVVNGTVTYAEGHLVGAGAGQVLRS